MGLSFTFQFDFILSRMDKNFDLSIYGDAIENKNALISGVVRMAIVDAYWSDGTKRHTLMLCALEIMKLRYEIRRVL